MKLQREKRHLPLITINHCPLIAWESCENDAFIAFSRHRVWCEPWLPAAPEVNFWWQEKWCGAASHTRLLCFGTGGWLLSAQVYFQPGRQEERGIRLRSIRRRGFGKSWQFVAWGLSWEKERDRRHRHCHLPRQNWLIQAQTTLKLFARNLQKNIANNLDVNGTKLIDSGANCDTLGTTMICWPAYYICLYQTNQA